MRYTERHAGKAVIREKHILPEAMEKLLTCTYYGTEVDF